ncbi:Ig-like domain-containing protein, partial [Salmonella enterica subsp. enterica serovar Cerro]|nr:Ig-like domain-containing protein [Salmonella enterica subsp. enterica serovar Cerro]
NEAQIKQAKIFETELNQFLTQLKNDIAFRSSSESSTRAIATDSTLTVPEIALAAGEDNGASDSDNVTNHNHTQPKFTLQHIDA